jgi:hypothetical protein
MVTVADMCYKLSHGCEHTCKALCIGWQQANPPYSALRLLCAIVSQREQRHHCVHCPTLHDTLDVVICRGTPGAHECCAAGPTAEAAKAAASPDLHRSASWCVTLRSRVLSMSSTASWEAARILSTRDRTCDGFNRVRSLTLARGLLQPRYPPRLQLQARLQLCPCHANSCDGVSCRCLVLRVRLCS